MIFVPVLLFTGLLFVRRLLSAQFQPYLLTKEKATNTPDLAVPAVVSVPNLPLNLGTVAAFLYALLYILMEPVAGMAIGEYRCRESSI
jgi:hypothetical protein